MSDILDEFTGQSPKLTATATEVKATRVGKIPWSSMDAYYVYLFPAPVNGIAQLPRAFPGRPLLFANSVTFEPFFDQDVPTSSGPPLAYDLCKVTVEYATLAYEQADSSADQIITRRVTVGGQYMTMPAVGFKWADTGETASNPDAYTQKYIGEISHEITVHRAPAVPYAYIRGLVGKVNHAAWNGAAKETVLFMGADIQQVIYSDGSAPYQITYKFQERNIDGDARISWNHMFDPTASKKSPQGKWRPILQINGEKLYKVGNFNLLM